MMTFMPTKAEWKNISLPEEINCLTCCALLYDWGARCWYCSSFQTEWTAILHRRTKSQKGLKFLIIAWRQIRILLSMNAG